MKPLKRKFVNKKKSAKQFRKNVSRTKAINLKPMSGPMRGGRRM